MGELRGAVGLRILRRSEPSLVYPVGVTAQLPAPVPPSRPVRRIVLLVTGSVALVLGVLGVVLPLLPTTPFILLAAACFAGTWPTMHRRLRKSRLFGPMLHSQASERHIPLHTKIGAIVFMWISIGATIVFVADALWLRVTLAVIAAGVTAFLLWMPSAPRRPE